MKGGGLIVTAFFIPTFLFIFVNMTVTELKKFFKKYPSIKQVGIAREAGISPMLLSYILSGERVITERTANKLKPIIEKYDGC